MAIQITETNTSEQIDLTKYNLRLSLTVVTSLFFMWGFITCMNDILIPFVRKVFELGRFESLLVQFAFFGAYFVGSLLYIIVSTKKGDPIVKIGYKNGLIIGLLVSAVGCALFYPAAYYKVYGLFLSALFILALGFTLLQIAANPYVAILGKPSTASSRLNLSQAFNSFGTTIAPIIGGYFIFKLFARWGSPLVNKMNAVILTDAGTPITANGVQAPYLIFAGIFLLLALIIKITRLPEITAAHEVVKGNGALKYRHLVLGVVAIFMYVGGEVSIGSVLINYMKEMANIPEMEAKSFLAFYWGGAMIGRFLGAISLSDNKSKKMKLIGMAFVSIITYLIIYGAVYLETNGSFAFVKIAPFIIFLALNYLFFILSNAKPARTLLLFSIAVIGLLLGTIVTSGMTAIWMVLGIGLFNSIMWSNIFTLAIKDLGKYTSQASSYLIMAILGGALVPLLMGYIADSLNGYHYSFFIAIGCYTYLAYYGWKGHSVLHK
jgi:FHS family L-fucose permease-like MFS transporter